MFNIPCTESTHVWDCPRRRCRKCLAPMPISGMSTPDGVPMNPRGSRFWKYIQQERKISLTSFSTANCVARVLPQLKDALAEAERRAKANPQDWKARMLVADVASLCRRVPEASTDTNAAVKSKAATHEAAGVSARDLEFD